MGISMFKVAKDYLMKIWMFKVAKDYSQPEVRRQQDEDKRLRLQVRSFLGED